MGRIKIRIFICFATSILNVERDEETVSFIYAQKHPDVKINTTHGLHEVKTGSDLLITRVSYCSLTFDNVFIISKNIKTILPARLAREFLSDLSVQMMIYFVKGS